MFVSFLIKFGFTQNPEWIIYNTANSGLSDNRVSALKEDTSDVIWIGTRFFGLSKFNGNNWTVYTPSNSGLPYNEIVRDGLEIDSIGNLWISTATSITMFDNNAWTVYNSGNSGLPPPNIGSIHIDKNNMGLEDRDMYIQDHVLYRYIHR